MPRKTPKKSTNDTLTLALEGDVSLDEFAQAVNGLRQLVRAIEAEKPTRQKNEWVVDDLAGGSAIARIRGIGESVPAVVDRYEAIGKGASFGKLPADPSIRDAVYKITDYIGKSGVTSVRFETADNDATVLQPVGGPDSIDLKRPAIVVPEIRLASDSLGSVRGRIQSITSRKNLQFTMYEVGSDRAISCYLEPGSESLMRKAWGRLAIVTGIVNRHPLTGQPVTVRHIAPSNIDLIPELTGSWRDAIGATKLRKGDEPSELRIRRLRDG